MFFYSFIYHLLFFVHHFSIFIKIFSDIFGIHFITSCFRCLGSSFGTNYAHERLEKLLPCSPIAVGVYGLEPWLYALVKTFPHWSWCCLIYWLEIFLIDSHSRCQRPWGLYSSLLRPSLTYSPHWTLTNPWLESTPSHQILLSLLKRGSLRLLSPLRLQVQLRMPISLLRHIRCYRRNYFPRTLRTILKFIASIRYILFSLSTIKLIILNRFLIV